MAERRMFSKKIIDSDEFLDMPLKTQSLYFHLAMRADDDGFINNPKKLIRAIGASQSDLEMLIEKRFIIAFDSGILAIRHWKVHNYIAKDRYHTTMFVDEKKQLSCDENGAYMDEKESVYNPYTTCIQPVYKVYTQVRLGKDSIDKDSIGEGSVVEVRLEKERLEEYSLGEVRLGEERIEKDRLEVVEGSVVEESTYTAHPPHTQTNEESSSLMANATANKGEALYSAYISNYGERGEYTPTPTRDIYNMKENSLDMADSGGFSYADEEDYSADYSPLNEDGYEEYAWELPRDYVSENPPPIGLDDGYFASLDDKDAPPEDDGLPWSRGNVAPENDGDYGEVFSGDWAVSTAPKKRHEAMENSARGLNEKDSALTENEPKDERRIDGIGDLSTPKAPSDSGVIKPIFGDHGRGIVCLSEWQLSDLKDRLGEHHLNRYMDKLATFISQRGARIRSHYDTILKWYNEDSPQREWQSADASYRENNSPKSTPNPPKTQGYNAPHQHERYGNFDPKEAFRAALIRTYGDKIDVDSIEI